MCSCLRVLDRKRDSFALRGPLSQRQSCRRLSLSDASLARRRARNLATFSALSWPALSLSFWTSLSFFCDAANCSSALDLTDFNIGESFVYSAPAPPDESPKQRKNFELGDRTMVVPWAPVFIAWPSPDRSGSLLRWLPQVANQRTAEACPRQSLRTISKSATARLVCE